MTYYEYIPDTPHEFRDGDVLGVFIPTFEDTYGIFFKEDSNAPLNYYVDGTTISPQEDFSIINANRSRESPLIAVEICELITV